MKIFNLAMANIKKGKGAAVSLFILIFVAALLLNIGLTVITQINSFYDDKVAELHDPHVSIIMEQADFEQPYEDFLRSYSGVDETETEEMILMSAARFRYAGSDMSSAAALLNADGNRQFSPLKVIEKLEPIHSDDIYLSYSFKASGGLNLGDTFTLTYQDIDYHYRVAGFFEATMLGTNGMGIIKFLLPDVSYRQLSGELGEQANGIFMSAHLTDGSHSSQLLIDYEKQFPNRAANDSSQYYWSADMETMKSVNTMTINIVAMILVAFAAIMVLVSLIVIKFRVTNSIDDGMVNIGVLKAIGYTSRQILASMLIQFMIITCSASVVGVAISYAVMPLFGGIITSLSGLLWVQGSDRLINLISVLIVVVLVLMVTLLSSLRIWNLAPVAALRGGIQTHSFRKNVFPLEKARGGLHFLLSCKTVLSNHKQNIMIVVIMVAITFASVFSIVLYYNIAKDKTAFIHLVGSETSNVIVQAKSAEDHNRLIADLERMEDVAKVTVLDFFSTEIDGQSFYTSVSEDYSRLNNNTVYKGRHPQYDNEIAISWLVAQMLHKGIGDTVKVEVGNISHSYLITGLSQSINYMGKTAALTLPGVRHLIPDYIGTNINVYLKGTDNESFIQSLKAQYGNLTNDIIDVDETIKSQSDVYISAVFGVMVVILAVTVLVVVMILYLVIKTMILKRKREFGIMKALGYTTIQLMNQIAMSFVPIVIIGVIIGSVLGCLYTNSLLTLLLSSAGVKNVQFIVSIPVVISLGVGLIAIAYLVSMFVSRRIKKISAYGLIIE